MQLLMDGGSVLLEYWRSLLPLLVAVLGFGSFGCSLLPGVTRDRRWLSFPLSLGTGVLLLTLSSFILFLVNLVWRSILELGAYAILLTGAALLLLNLRRRETRLAIGLGLPLFILLLTLRLAFVSKLALPPYNDSPVHYLVVLNLLDPASRPDAFYSFGNLLQQYYHFGVHSLTAWLALVSHENSPLLLAVLGQFFLSIFPFSVFALAGILAENGLQDTRKSAAWAAALVAAFGSWMPAYAANWGKYPTLASLAVLPVTLVYLFAGKAMARNRAILILTALLVAGTFLLHSRTILLIALAMIGYFSTAFASRRLSNVPIISAGVGILLTASLIYGAWLHPNLAGYYTSNWPLLVFLAILVPFACAAYPVQTLATLLVFAGMGLPPSVQVPFSQSNPPVVLLDRAFVQIALVLPIAMLAGFGIAGIGRRLAPQRRLRSLPIILLGLLIMVQMPPIKAFYPDDCCSYVTDDDLRALEWLKLHVPPQGLVVIAGIPSKHRMLETDAGVWVYPMTGADTAKRSFNSSLSDPAFLNSVCQGRLDVYIYAGRRALSFELPQGPAIFQDYAVVFSSGETRVLLVKACPRR